MYKLIFFLIGLLISLNVFAADQFCNGFEKGYISGYKKAKNTSLEPLTPICPIQPLKKFGDPDSDFEHGYMIGLAKGMDKGSN